MKRENIKKFIIPVLAILFTAWVIRVIYINRTYAVDTVYLRLNDTIDYGDHTIIPAEARLFTLDEYEDFFGVQVDKGDIQGNSKEDKIIGLKLRIINTSEGSLPWSDVLSDIGMGFESLTWCSVSDPWLGRDINILYDDCFKTGVEIEFWLVTRVSRISFGAGSWKKLRAEDFMFTLDIYPEPVRIIFK